MALSEDKVRVEVPTELFGWVTDVSGTSFGVVIADPEPPHDVWAAASVEVESVAADEQRYVEPGAIFQIDAEGIHFRLEDDWTPEECAELARLRRNFEEQGCR